MNLYNANDIDVSNTGASNEDTNGASTSTNVESPRINYEEVITVSNNLKQVVKELSDSDPLPGHISFTPCMALLVTARKLYIAKPELFMNQNPINIIYLTLDLFRFFNNVNIPLSVTSIDLLYQWYRYFDQKRSSMLTAVNPIYPFLAFLLTNRVTTDPWKALTIWDGEIDIDELKPLFRDDTLSDQVIVQSSFKDILLWVYHLLEFIRNEHPNMLPIVYDIIRSHYVSTSIFTDNFINGKKPKTISNDLQDMYSKIFEGVANPNRGNNIKDIPLELGTKSNAKGKKKGTK